MEGIKNDRPPWPWALATFAVVFGIYLLTLAPTIAFWDTAEYIAAAKVLGIPHPPGNPLFTLLAHVWGLIPFPGEYAIRINLFAAFTSAAGAAFWFLVAERWLRDILPSRGPRIAAAFAGVFSAAMAWTVWHQSTVNEKVYTISLLTIALVVWLSVYWADQPEGERRDRWIILAVYLSILSSTNHQMGLLGLPVVGWYVITTDWRMVLRWRVLTSLILAFIVGISLHYVYLPLRAAQFPPINEGEPIGFFSQALMDNLGRVQYQKPSVTQRMATFGAQLTNYWQYWTWQWGRDLGSLQGLATGLFTALGLGGLIALIRRNRREGLAALGLIFTLTILLVYYLNFKYGFSYHPEDRTLAREVRERDYFFLISFAYAGVLFAAGFAATIKAIGDWFGDRIPDSKRLQAGLPVLLLAFVPLVGNRISAPRSHETLARDFAIDMLESIEPYGILITAGDNDTFPLWFAQEVLGVRRDVTLANLSLMNTDWHLRQIRRRPQEAFNPQTANAYWSSGTDTSARTLGLPPVGSWTMPDTPVLTQSESEINALPEIARTPANPVLDFPIPGGDSIRIVFGREYLERADLAAVLMIRDNIGKRPIYFSWSDADYPDERLGLTPYLLSQGLVRKLMPDTLVAGGNIVEAQYLGFVDMQRTRDLIFNVYHPEAAGRERPAGWVDVPSATILQLYALTYISASELFKAHGEQKLADSAATWANKITRNWPGGLQ